MISAVMLYLIMVAHSAKLGQRLEYVVDVYLDTCRCLHCGVSWAIRMAVPIPLQA